MEWQGVVSIIIFSLAFLVGLWFLVRWADKRSKARLAAVEARKKDLIDRFGIEAAEKIIDGTIWQGETSEMLLLSLGKPAAIDEKILKTKTRQIWKYSQTAKNKYATRITLENDIVTGWDIKR